MLHLKIEVEKKKFLACVEECRAELARETTLVPQAGSEEIIKEHRVRHTRPERSLANSHGHVKEVTDTSVWVWELEIA